MHRTGQPRHRRAPTRLSRGVLAFACACAIATATPPAGTGASAGTVVGATVPSATSLTSNCTSGVAGKTDFGVVLTSSENLTTSDCEIVFGSSNDTARLRMVQADGTGSAMWQSSTGALNAGFAGGYATGLFGAGTHSEGHDAVVDPQGRTLILQDSTRASDDGGITRYLANGTVDASFGTAGTAWVDSDPVEEWWYDLLMLPDQRMLIAGYSLDPVTGNNVAVARLLPDGSLDPTFGVGGIAQHSAGASTDLAIDMAVDAQGRIVIAGVQFDGPNNTFQPMAGRLTSSGQLDATFGTGGFTTFEPWTSTWNAWVTGLALLPDGRLVVTGTRGNGNYSYAGMTFSDSFVAVLTTQGVLDTSFSGDGYIEYDEGTFDTLRDVQIRGTGEILAAGSVSGATTNTQLVGLDTTGAPLAGFGATGVLTVDINAVNDAVTGFVVLPDGKLLGYGRMGPGQYGAATMRFNASGTLDTTYGSAGGGFERTAVGTNAYYTGATLTPDGGLALAGLATVAGVDNALVARTADRPIADYDGAGSSWAGAGSMFGACMRQAVGAAPAAPWIADLDTDCLDGDADPWHGVAAWTSGPASSLATTASTATGTVRMRFGLQVGASQAAGAAYAPIVFEVVAPQ